MTTVAVFVFPANDRVGLYPGDTNEDGELLPVLPQTYLELPIKMPRSVQVTTVRARIVAIDVLGEGGGRIKREDLATVWQGICQFNNDCEKANF